MPRLLSREKHANGLGATLTWHSLAKDDIQSRELLQILDYSIPSNLGYQLVMPGNKTMLSKVAAFWDWLFKQVGDVKTGDK